MSEPGSGAADTPIMKQYQAAKQRYPRHLLFFRIGDFYELFWDDAKTIARVLGLTLTSRNKGPDAIPMAGVPCHSAEGYLARLLRQGYSVAICDQVEAAAQAKGLVKREVTRVVTPGTVLEENLLDARKPNRLVAIVPEKAAGGSGHSFGLACADLTSGAIYIQTLSSEVSLRSEFARLTPSECLLPENPAAPAGVKAPALVPEAMLEGIALTRLKPAAFAPSEAHERLVAHFSQNGRDKQRATALKKLAKEQPLAMSAAGAVLGYIQETYPGVQVHLLPPEPFDPDKFLTLGDSAIRSLELLETMRTHSFEGSLLWSIDRTCTGPGGRCLREWLIRPLRELTALKERHDAVAALATNADLRNTLREALKSLADLERIAARLSTQKATPRDLVALKQTLENLPSLSTELQKLLDGEIVLPMQAEKTAGARDGGLRLLAQINARLNGFTPLASEIAATLKDDCSHTITEGGLLKNGVNAELDRLRGIASGGKEWIARFQASEAERTGIASLKVGYNSVFGYYIEISRANKHLAPKEYERKQTLTNAERFTTPELKEREAEVLGAQEKICALEQKLFLALRDSVAQWSPKLHDAGMALAELDALASLAEVAHRKGHVRPILTDGGRLQFDQMRHPVLEDTIPRGSLVPNDLLLDFPQKSRQKNGGDAPQIILLTGPNMAGKSTYIRSAALCTILAQMGAFVPAEKAEVGLVDRIFTRVGAADDLASGRSTFMVEMSEVAEILAACSTRSLVILDEVGRGTSTYDGVSLAWALVEFLHEGPAKPRTLFATHYHELCALDEELPRLANASASVKEWQGEITFLHRIVSGPSERSFGIHVARLAGLPADLIERARAILQTLEQEASARVNHLTDGGADLTEEKTAPAAHARKLTPQKTDGQLQLFEPPSIDANVTELLAELRALDPQRLTPLDALSILDKLVRKARS